MKIVERHRRFRYSDDRFFNDLQELRNSLIVLNVLLRKSIQRAEVHPVISIPYLPGTISASARSQSSRSRRCGKRCLWAIAAVCRSMRCAIIRPDPQCDQLYQSEPGGIKLSCGHWQSSSLSARATWSNLFRSEVG